MRRKPKLPKGGYNSSEDKCFDQSFCKHVGVRDRTEAKITKVLFIFSNRGFKKKTRIPMKSESRLCNCAKNKSRQSAREEGPSQYTVYCIVNTGFFMNKGNLVASVARGFLGLYNKIDKDRVKSRALDSWEDSGEKLVVLKGFNHKHLKHLADEMRFAAVDIHGLYMTWGRSQIMLVLSVLGREEDLEECIDGLTYLR